MRIAAGDPWIVRWSACRSPRLRLFCLPYAGGGAQVFRAWGEMLPDLDVSAVQLPGREQRHAEAPLRRIAPAVEAVSAALARHLDGPFALFGHSMGGMLAYEVARRLSAAGFPPEHLFVSGHKAPHLPSRRRPLHGLDDPAFVAGLRALDGTPGEVFEHPELVALLLPMLRADFELVETYAALPGARLACPVTALGGTADRDVPAADVAAWAHVTDGAFAWRLVEGGHFFLNSARERVVAEVRRGLGG